MPAADVNRAFLRRVDGHLQFPGGEASCSVLKVNGNKMASIKSQVPSPTA